MANHIHFGSFKINHQGLFLQHYHTLLGEVEIFMTLAMEGTLPEAQRREIAEQMFAVTQQALAQRADAAVYERFEECLKQMNAYLEEQSGLEGFGPLHALVAVLEGRTLHVTKTGLAESYLLRRGRLIDISEGLYEENGESFFLNIATGDLEAHDRVLFTSKRILKFVSKNELCTIFSAGRLNEGLEELKEVITLDATEDLIVSAFEIDKDQAEEAAAPVSSPKSAHPKVSLDRLQRSGSKLLSHFKKLSKGEDRNKYLTLGILIIVVILLVSLNFTSSQNSRNSLVTENKQMLDDARGLLNKAKTAGIADKGLAKELLNESKKKAFAVRESKLMYADVMNLISEIEQEEEKLDNIVREKSPKVFIDLAKKDDQVDSRGLIYFSPNRGFYVYSKTGMYGPIIDSNPDSYAFTKVPEDELKTGTEFLDANSLVFLTEGNKVMEFTKGKFEFQDTTDEVWKAGVALRSFGNRRYLYILDAANSNIWKYERAKVGYRGAVSYNVGNVDLSDAISLALDGNVYILHKSGAITKMYDKQKVAFDLIGAPSQPLADLRSDSAIYTNEEIKNVYILDTKGKRVLIYNKTDDNKLTYVKQYVYEMDDDVRGFYITQDETKLYVLGTQKIYVTDLSTDS